MDESYPARGDKGTLNQIVKAIRQLNPGRIAREAERGFVIVLAGSSEEEIAAMRRFLLGPNASARDIEQAGHIIGTYIAPAGEPAPDKAKRADFILVHAGSEGVFDPSDKPVVFHPDRTARIPAEILARPRGQELRLSLANHLPALRPEVARRTIRETSGENAVFVIATALGNVIPSVFQPVIGVAEAAGDIAFLTANQIRMLFALGAAYGGQIGYGAQWREISSIIGAGFGWRSIARNLVSKIPFGGGLIPKGAVAYAGTMAVGEGIRFYYATGRRMTREDVNLAFRQSYSEAAAFARSAVGRLRPGRSESSSGES